MSITCLSHKEWLRLVSGVTNLRDSLIFEILYSTGCSESELISIRVKDIDIRNKIISFAKRKSMISYKAAALISSQLTSEKQDDYLFSTRQSSQLTSKRVQQIVMQASKAALGKSVKPIEIRYSHIYHAMLKGVSIVSIAKQTGLGFQRLAQIIEDISKARPDEFGYRYEL